MAKKKIDEIVDGILTEWETDCIISESNIEHETLSTPQLHSKYLRLLAFWKNKQTACKVKLHEMQQLKTRYWRGEMGKEELNQLGWEQWQYNKPLKNEIEGMLKADSDVSSIQIQVEGCETIVYILESIMKQITSRNFEIANFIKMKMFNRGDTP